jgi:hypothetical protein
VETVGRSLAALPMPGSRVVVERRLQRRGDGAGWALYVTPDPARSG